MSGDFISREAATVYAPLPKYLRNYQTENLDDAWEDGYDYAISQIDAIPAADVVEVVRCRECIYLEKDSKFDMTGEGNEDARFCGNIGCCTNDDWFCANGERKDEGQDE